MYVNKLRIGRSFQSSQGQVNPGLYGAPITTCRCRSITIPAKTITISQETGFFPAGEGSHHGAQFQQRIGSGDKVYDVAGCWTGAGGAWQGFGEAIRFYVVEMCITIGIFYD